MGDDPRAKEGIRPAPCQLCHRTTTRDGKLMPCGEFRSEHIKEETGSMPMMADSVRCTFQGECRRVVELLTMQQSSHHFTKTPEPFTSQTEQSSGNEGITVDSLYVPLPAIPFLLRCVNIGSQLCLARRARIGVRRKPSVSDSQCRQLNYFRHCDTDNDGAQQINCCLSLKSKR